jgi:hypothetical protein
MWDEKRWAGSSSAIDSDSGAADPRTACSSDDRTAICSDATTAHVGDAADGGTDYSAAGERFGLGENPAGFLRNLSCCSGGRDWRDGIWLLLGETQDHELRFGGHEWHQFGNESGFERRQLQAPFCGRCTASAGSADSEKCGDRRRIRSWMDVSLAKLQKMATEQARKQATEASKKGQPQDNPLAMLKETDQIQGLVKNFGLSGADSNGKVFSFTIQKNFGDDSWSGMRLVESAVPGFHDVTGIGDHAMIGSFGHAFYFVKGETMVHMDTSLVPDVRTRGAVIAKKILGKL